jgi:hypothetical protein
MIRRWRIDWRSVPGPRGEGLRRAVLPGLSVGSSKKDNGALQPAAHAWQAMGPQYHTQGGPTRS